MQKPKIHALFTAINDYQSITPLGGCVNDANNIANYITNAAKSQNRAISTLKLYNEKATKTNIVNGLNQHLGKATSKDICVFYFSGHGGQENAPEAFKKHEPDLKLEVLACVDSNFQHQGSFLADKELRYLLSKLYQKTKAQIITIFDCCHSGTNTRNTANTLISRQVRLMDNAPVRKWDGFIFKEEISEKMVATANALSDIIPEGKHLQLAACENKQSAYELNGKGIFTSNLVKTLEQTKGNISYRDLISALKLKIQGSFEQTPQIYATGAHQMIFHSFLGGLTAHQLHKARVVFNQQMGNWTLNMGALHGINKDQPNFKIDITVPGKSKSISAKAITTLPDYTILQINQSNLLKEDQIYEAALEGLILKTLRIFLKGDATSVKYLSRQLADQSEDYNTIELVDASSLADYLVEVNKDTIQILTVQGERQIIKAIQGKLEKNGPLLFQYLAHISKWHFVRDLENPAVVDTTALPLDIHIFSVDKKNKSKELPIVRNTVETPLTEIPAKNSKQHPQGKMRILIKNNSDKAYYCSLIYLSQDFGIMTDFLKEDTLELIPNGEVWAWEGDNIPYQQEHYIKQENWSKETAYLKLIISKETFDVTQLTLESLPHPSTPANRSVMKRDRKDTWKNPALPDWMSRLITVEIKNPYFEEPLAS